MAKKNAFISFDYDNDAFLRDALVEQSRKEDSPFEFFDRSVKEHLTGDWVEKVKGRIGRADLVIVICGENTHLAKGVAIELEIAKLLRKPYFLLHGYRGRICTKPTSAHPTEVTYDWNWPNLKALIGSAR